MTKLMVCGRGLNNLTDSERIIIVFATKKLVSIQFIVDTVITRFTKDAKISDSFTAAVDFTCQCCSGMAFLLDERL